MADAWALLCDHWKAPLSCGGLRPTCSVPIGEPHHAIEAEHV